MTREEAIYELKNAAWLGTDHSRARTEEAVEMAIQALSQEPTKEEKALLKKWRDNRGVSMEEFEDAMNALQEPQGVIIRHSLTKDSQRHRPYTLRTYF